MSKPALYWTLVGSPYSRHDLKPMAVTSEKPGRMIYGRDGDGMGTHRKWHDRHGRFPDEAAAKAAITIIRQKSAKARADLAQAHEALRQAMSAETAAIKAALAELGAEQ